MSSNEPQWVVAPDEARIEIAVGKDAKISPALREALNQLAQALESASEVQGYASTNCPHVTIVPDCDFLMICRGVTTG